MINKNIGKNYFQNVAVCSEIYEQFIIIEMLSNMSNKNIPFLKLAVSVTLILEYVLDMQHDVTKS